MSKKHNKANFKWHTMDIHIHTPGSADYQQPNISYLSILQRAETRGLDIIAFTDHNTISGYRKMKEEIFQLETLETLNRLLPEEKTKLNEYRRLLNKMLVLPGIEVTATFGFHILGIFSPNKPVREIEHLLLSLNIPSESLDEGAMNVGATADVLTTYRLINQAGGLVIAAHANSSNGVAMKGFNFGGQTKIAYTQDPNLHALEVTDLDLKSNRSTANFFNGTKPEYPRRMHCIQGSDAHRLVIDSQRKKNFGIGDRSTDVLLPELTFEALREIFLGNDFSRTRPNRHIEEPAYDFIQLAIEQGSNIIQEFHETMTIRGGKQYAILADICAFANTNGGTIYIGIALKPKKIISGVEDAEQAIRTLEIEIGKRISPPLKCAVNIDEFSSKKIIRILIPRGDDPPYALDDSKIYIRNESETGLAVRDEIVGLVLRGKKPENGPIMAVKEDAKSEMISTDENTSPRTGVEVIDCEDREGTNYYTMRDLRNGNIVKNVTESSARKLWHYAITRYKEIKKSPEKMKIKWSGNFGMMKRAKQGKTTLYDLVERKGQNLHFYFGVNEDGIHGAWKIFAGEE